MESHGAVSSRFAFSKPLLAAGEETGWTVHGSQVTLLCLSCPLSTRRSFPPSKTAQNLQHSQSSTSPAQVERGVSTLAPGALFRYGPPWWVRHVPLCVKGVIPRLWCCREVPGASGSGAWLEELSSWGRALKGDWDLDPFPSGSLFPGFCEVNDIPHCRLRHGALCPQAQGHRAGNPRAGTLGLNSLSSS